MAKAAAQSKTVSWRKIPISLTDPQKGEQTAHACEKAWLQELTVGVFAGNTCSDAICLCAMSAIDWLIVAPAVPVAPIFVTWWLPWETWIPWAKLPKALLGPYALYLFFVGCHFDEHLGHLWYYIWLAIAGVFLSVTAVIEKVNGSHTTTRKSKRLQIRLNDNGFVVSTPGSTQPIESVVWGKVNTLLAYKRDLYAMDLICLGFVMKEGTIEVHEDMKGWSQLVGQLPSLLPGVPPFSDWWERVAKQPFAASVTTLYTRG